jgi:antitoxin MazE
MQATVSKWGNSLALRLPRQIADELRLAEGASVTLEVSEGTLRVTPKRKRFRLSELLAGEPKLEGQGGREFDWGPPRGNEEW